MTVGFDGEEADRVLQELGEAITTSPKYDGYEWTGISVVFEFDGNDPSQFGFVYMAGDVWEARAPGLPALRLIPDFRDATHVPDEAPWIKCLVQIDRTSGKIDVEFDYEGTQWNVDMANPAALALALRP